MWYFELVATPTWRGHRPWSRAARKDYRLYEIDVTDKEWAAIEAMIPKQGHLGRPRMTNLREIFNVIQDVLATWDASDGRCRVISRLIRRPRTTFIGVAAVFSAA